MQATWGETTEVKALERTKLGIMSEERKEEEKERERDGEGERERLGGIRGKWLVNCKKMTGGWS